MSLQCPKCQRPANEGARFCSACGTALTSQAPAKASGQKAGERPPGNWRRFKNAWYGFTLEKPVGWFERTFNGVTTVAPDAEGYVGVLTRPLQVRKGTSTEMLARHVAGMLNKTLGAFHAWSDPPLKGEVADPNILVMRYQGTYKNVPLVGVLVLRVSGELALLTGFQAPASKMSQLAPTMQYCMTSLRFIEPVPQQKYQETNEGAFTGLAPQGWTVRATMRRSPDSTRMPLVHLVANDPTGKISMQTPPEHQQYTERMNPMLMMGGPTFMQVQSAVQYIQRVLLANIRQQHPSAQIEKIEQRADLAERATREAARTDHFGFGTVCDVASVSYTEQRDGTLYRTKDFMQITHMRAIGLWSAKITAILRAPADQFEEQEAICAGMVESIKPNEQWERQEIARGDQLFMQAQQRLARVQQQQVVALRNLHQTEMSIAENVRAGINRRTEQFSALQQDLTRVINGYEYVYDPFDQKVYDVMVGPGQLWGGDGYVYRTNSGLTPPKLGLHKLEPLG